MALFLFLFLDRQNMTRYDNMIETTKFSRIWDSVADTRWCHDPEQLQILYISLEKSYEIGPYKYLLVGKKLKTYYLCAEKNSSSVFLKFGKKYYVPIESIFLNLFWNIYFKVYMNENFFNPCRSTTCDSGSQNYKLSIHIHVSHSLHQKMVAIYDRLVPICLTSGAPTIGVGSEPKPLKKRRTHNVPGFSYQKFGFFSY